MSALKDNKGLCCLGHLCLVADRKFKYDENSASKEWRCENESALLPISISREMGFPGRAPRDPIVRVGKGTYSLSFLNDQYGFTLPEIADVVEADWVNGFPLQHHPKLEK